MICTVDAAAISDRNYLLTNVTIRVSRDGRTANGWKWQLLDFFKLQVDCGPERGMSLTKRQAQQQASVAKTRYKQRVEVVKVSLEVDGKKPLPSTSIPRRKNWGNRPNPASRNPLPHQRCPGPS